MYRFEKKNNVLVILMGEWNIYFNDVHHENVLALNIEHPDFNWVYLVYILFIRLNLINISGYITINNRTLYFTCNSMPSTAHSTRNVVKPV